MDSSTCTVYGAILSPFVRKVLMALEYKQLPYRNEVVLPFDRTERFRRISPLHKIPAYRDAEVTLSDSSVICDYLEQRHPEPALYPCDSVLRARCLWFEELADTRLQELLGVGLFFQRVLLPRMFGRAPDEVKVRASLRALPRQLDYLESEAPGDGPFVGSTWTVADLILPGVFLNASYAGFDVDAGRWPRLAGYLARCFEDRLYRRRISRERELLAALDRASAAREDASHAEGEIRVGSSSAEARPLRRGGPV